MKFHFTDLHFDLPPPDTFLGQAVIVLRFTSDESLRDVCNNDSMTGRKRSGFSSCPRMFVLLFLLTLRKV